MSGRITAADVQVVVDDADAPGARRVMAMVTGRNRTYVVDFDPRWSDSWMCTCGNAPACAHVRATKEAIR